MVTPQTATGRKVVAVHGSVLLDDVVGIEDEARITFEETVSRLGAMLTAAGCRCWALAEDGYHAPTCPLVPGGPR